METVTKARIRMEHWIAHNDHHESEYAAFAEELEKRGLDSAAAEVKRMIEYNAKSNECLRRALESMPAQ